ncbi:MAG: sensor histidine kinase [Coprococcus sp.]
MSLYYKLSTNVHIIYGVIAVLLMMIALFILVTVCTWHIERKYVLSSALLAIASMTILQGINDVNLCLCRQSPMIFLADIIGNLSSVVMAFLLFFIAVAEFLFIIILGREKRNRLTPGAIKEGLDELPDGVCFFTAAGQPLLVNNQMNRISSELFETEILNAEDFWSRLKKRERRDGETEDSDICRVICCTENGRIWDVRRSILDIEHHDINEIIAYDVTRQYELNHELDKRNRQLSKVNERLRHYSLNIEQMTIEKEILAAKMQVHDNVGQSLLAFRSYLAKPQGERDRNELMLLWHYTIDVLKNEAVPVSRDDGMELLLKAAQAVAVEIVQTGSLPENGELRDILIAALHECLTNTVKHANGNKLYITIGDGGNEVTAEITNNGMPPNDRIQETGGLNSIRHIVEAADGKMIIQSKPCFILQIELPKGENFNGKN